MKHKELIERMTAEEKASLTSGANFWNSKAVERVGVPSFTLTDGPHGLRKQKGQADHLGLNSSVPSTCYPTAAGLANSWDMELIEALGERLGREAAAERVSVVLGPGCNIKRNPLCGRNFEYFSEDPFLSGKAAAALIRGVQKMGVSACVKHFAANSQELHRMASDSVVDERTLREIYLPAFETAVREGGVRCLMTSYNLLNGVYTNENTYLLRDILRVEWGYEGMVVTDWGGNNDRVAGLIAGDHLEMPGVGGETDGQVLRALRDGSLDEKYLDEAADALIEMALSTREYLGGDYDRDEHHAFASKAAGEAAVLLKNEGGVLPIGRRYTVAVMGDFAKRPRYQGAGSSLVNPTRLEDPLDELKKAGLRVVGYAKGFRRGGGRSEKLIKEAVALAKRADIALLFLGLDEGGEAEGMDRADMRLPENQTALLRAVAAENPNTVVVLSCGCAVETDWDKDARALLHGYLGGQAGASAMARLLTGRENPSGKLTETMPLRYEDSPSAPYFPGPEATAEYREGIYVGYRGFDSAKRAVKYPFGHGLSYTGFEYSDLEISDGAAAFTIKNCGAVTGAEVAQLYVSARTGGMFRPEKELKGFARVLLSPGESKRVSIPLDERSFAVWSVIEKRWVVEPGEYGLLIGASSRDIRLTGSVVKTGEAVENPYAADVFAPYKSADVSAVSDESFAALLGREIPPSKWDRKAPLGMNSVIAQGAYLKGGPGRLIYELVRLGRASLRLLGLRSAADTLMYAMELPYRGLSRMTGVFTEKQVESLLRAVNRAGTKI